MRYFGTDGVRGVVNEQLTPQLAYALGLAAAEVLGAPLVVGRDTRRSGTMLESALAAGITARGGDVLVAGIVPTPAVAFTVRELGVAGGVVISASHNPAEYNGIKFFDAQGFKLSREQEERFEQLLEQYLSPTASSTVTSSSTLAPANRIGVVRRIAKASERYIAHAVGVLKQQGISLAGLKVAVDCAHGAAAH